MQQAKNINYYTLEKLIVANMRFCLSVTKNHVWMSVTKKIRKNHISRRILGGKMILGHNVVGL